MNEIQDYTFKHMKSPRIVRKEEIEVLLDFEIELAKVKLFYF